MRRLTLVFSTCLLSATLVSCAGGQTDTAMASDGPRQCFLSSNVSSFGSNGPNLAIIRVGGDAWELELAPGCPDVDNAMRVGIVSRGRSDICEGRPAELVVPNASGRTSERCLVRNVRKLSPEEAAAARGQTLKP